MILAEIITIGDEILIGQVIDTNSAWMAEQLNLTGIRVNRITSISDTQEEIINALTEASQRADIVLMTGGLGPTNDDITKKTLAGYFNSTLVFNEETFENISRLFEKRGFRMNEANRLQACIPACCRPVTNPEGTAPGMWFEENGKIFISMPGVPFEMKAIMAGSVLPELKKRFNRDAIIHKTVLTQGVGESWIAEKIAGWEAQLPSFIKLAYLPQPGLVRLRLTATGSDIAVLKEQVDLEINKLLAIIPDIIFGYDAEKLEEIVGKLLVKSGKTLSIAESCTGGYISHLITSVPGSSAYFKGSVISYSNEIKLNELGVDSFLIDRYGAVSEEVVKAMADGIRYKYHTDYAIAVTGIAGPDGGTPEKPVGTVWIAVASEKNLITRVFQMGEHRMRNIHKSALSALNMLRKEMI